VQRVIIFIQSDNAMNNAVIDPLVAHLSTVLFQGVDVGLAVYRQKVTVLSWNIMHRKVVQGVGIIGVRTGFNK
jgi:CheY-specific phosphatase CheX